jgi:hypothetical protein
MKKIDAMDRMLGGSPNEENEEKDEDSYKKFTHALREAFLKKVRQTEQSIEKQ